MALIVILSAILLIGLAVLLLGVKVFFVKGGKFPSGHAHDNPGSGARVWGAPAATTVDASVILPIELIIIN